MHRLDSTSWNKWTTNFDEECHIKKWRLSQDAPASVCIHTRTQNTNIKRKRQNKKMQKKKPKMILLSSDEYFILIIHDCVETNKFPKHALSHEVLYVHCRVHVYEYIREETILTVWNVDKS